MRLSFLWHMHQPRYVDPDTGVALLPWVRLHAASGYLDMARALERAPAIRATVNFQPSLVEQLEHLRLGKRDVLEALAERPVSSLEPRERALVIERSFSVARRAIDARPRYREIEADAKGRIDDRALRDLECLFLLAWLGYAARQDFPEIAELEARGRDFSEGDKAALLAVTRQAASRVLPAWSKLAARDQVELASSPYYHPIIPLLVDSDFAARARPHDPRPPRFAHPGDAELQIERALEQHERVFGRGAAGMWPPEGSLSPEAVALYAKLGVKWLAADEGLLEHTLAMHFGRHPSPDELARERARVHRLAGEATRPTALVFRHRELSDRIGFAYQHAAPEQAAEDFVRRALDARRHDARGGDVLGVFLDGENAWEHYEGRAEPFFRALYERLERLADAGELRTATLAEVTAEASKPSFDTLHSGSWIGSDFRIWIGDPVKNRAWALLGRARAHVQARASAGAPAERVASAIDRLLIAEGSDWFWWFGAPNHSREDPLYDDLFRRTIAAAYRELGDEPPADVHEPLH